MSDTRPQLHAPTTNPQVTSPTETMDNASGPAGDNASQQQYPFDPNGPGTAVGVPQHTNRDATDPMPDLPIDSNGELTDYDEETPARVTVSELADEGESFSNMPEVTGGDVAAGNNSAQPHSQSVGPDEDIGLELVGDSQTGTGGMIDNFKEEMQKEQL